MKLANPRHWGKIGEMEQPTRLECHQWVFEEKDPESVACGHVLEGHPAYELQVRKRYMYVHAQSVNASAYGNGSRDPSERMSDLESLSARSECVHVSLCELTKKTADVHLAWRVGDHVNGHYQSDCCVRGHSHREHDRGERDRGEHAHLVNDADVNDHGHESDPA